MALRLVIAEKPSVAQTIAAALGVKEKKDGYIEGGGCLISWCVGHLVQLAEAAAYGEQYRKWQLDSLPILPEEWQYAVDPDKGKQFKTLKELMHRADVSEVVNACDAGREGELIFRFVYEAAGCKKPMRRLWISSMEEAAIKEGFSHLKNGEAYNEGKASAEDVGVKAEDDKTLKVTLENPTAYFIDLTAVTAYFPVKKDAVEGPEAWTKSADTYVSNGAFRLKEINPQASYVLEKNPEYIDADTVKLDGVNIVFIESAEAALSAYNAGEVDVVDNTIIQTQAQSQYGGSDELKSYDLIGTCYYDFNCEKDYLSDARVRKALAMSLNRDVINQSIVASRPESSYAFVPHGIPYEGSSEDYRTTVGNLFTEDVEAAKALMEEAGYPGGEGYPTLTLITQNDQEKKDVAQAMQAMWKENLGVNVEIVTFEPKVYWDEQTAGNFDICYDGWTGDYPDPSTNLDCFLLQRNETQCRWLNDQAKEYDSMMKEARSLTDNKKRMELFEAGEKLLMEEMPILPLYYRNAQLLVKPGCEGVIKTYIGHTIFKYADKQ